MSKHYYIESDRIVSKIGGGMELNIVPLDTCMYAFNIEDIDDYKDKSVANSKMMYRHFDSTLVEDEVLVDANFGWLIDCANNNDFEKDIYFYHKDHLGSSTQITDRDATVIHHIEYMPSGEQFAEQRSTWGTSYKFNSKELDAETGLYYYGARYYNPALSIWASVDPMSDKYPSMSPYMYCAGNPVVLVDPDGMDIDPTSSGYDAARLAATPGSKTYQPAFAKLYNKWKDDKGINVQFNSNISNSRAPDEGGTIEYRGNDNDGENGRERDIYMVSWNPSITKELGTSAMFEEAKHLDDGVFGKKFDVKQGCSGFSIINEVEAKQWVIDNITDIKGSYMELDGSQYQTHYGHFLENPNDLTPKILGYGIPVNIIHRSGIRIGNLYGTGGKSYKNLYDRYVFNNARQFLPKGIFKN